MSDIVDLDPGLCRRPASHPAITAEECAYLVASLRDSGQQAAAIVRPTPPGDTHVFEIVCGIRRHAAITALRASGENPAFMLRARIRTLTDAEAFATADHDNRQRRDITDYRRAIDYSLALSRHFSGDACAMAAALGLQLTELGRYLMLAALPAPLFSAFGDPNRITTAHLRKLAPCLQNPAHAVTLLQAADRLALDQSMRRLSGRFYLRPETILHRLIRAVFPAPLAPPVHTILSDTGARIATGQRRRGNTISLDLFAVTTTPAPRLLQATVEILAHLTAPKDYTEERPRGSAPWTPAKDKSLEPICLS
jgi:ParB family chromosome partitioning protein